MVRTVKSFVRDVVLAELVHGGQRRSRENAWRSMRTDAERAAQRGEVERLLSRAELDAAIRRRSS